MPIGIYQHDRKPIQARFWAKVRFEGPVPIARADLGRCWIWRGSKNKLGYGHFYCERKGVSRSWLAHVVSYEIARGIVPDGQELDHLCCNPSCINPKHLEAVTHTENILRGNSPYARKKRQTHCMNGHLFDSKNTIITKKGTRKCRSCTNAYVSMWRARNPNYMKEWRANAERSRGDRVSETA